MGLEGSRWEDRQEKNFGRSQERNLTIGNIADGYKNKAEELFASPAGAAIRNEVKNNLNVVDLEGPEQLEALQKLARSLEAYKSALADVSTDSSERAALALALIRHEKGLQ